MVWNKINTVNSTRRRRCVLGWGTHLFVPRGPGINAADQFTIRVLQLPVIFVDSNLSAGRLSKPNFHLRGSNAHAGGASADWQPGRMILYKTLPSAALIHTSGCAFCRTFRGNACAQLRAISWPTHEMCHFAIYHRVLEVLCSKPSGWRGTVKHFPRYQTANRT